MMLENLIQQMRDVFRLLPDEQVETIVGDAVESYQEFGKELAIAIYFHGSTKPEVDAGLEWWRQNYKASLLQAGVYEEPAEQMSQIATDILVQGAYAVALNMSSEGGNA